MVSDDSWFYSPTGLIFWYFCLTIEVIGVVTNIALVRIRMPPPSTSTASALGWVT